MKFLVKIFSSVFFIGYIPLASGTFASAFAVLPYLLIRNFWTYFPVTIVLFFLGVFASTEAEKIYKETDPHKVVIDEVVGYLITMAFVPFGIWWMVAGFFLFRLFDIWKPFPVMQSQKLPGGWGIMVDDVLAGVYANVVLQVAVLVINK